MATGKRTTKWKRGPCHHHRPVVIGDKLYMWEPVTSKLEIFDVAQGIWNQRTQFESNPPVPAEGYFCSAVGQNLYFFGGRSVHGSYDHYNSIHKLDFENNFKWSEIEPDTIELSKMIVPVMKRGYGEMISFDVSTNDHISSHLFMVGGIGTKPHEYASGASYTSVIESRIERVRTNEQNIYDIEGGQWVPVKILGKCMQPNSGFTMVKSKEDSAVLFGGVRDHSQQFESYSDTDNQHCYCPVNNDLYIVNFKLEQECFEVTWQPIKDSIHWPKARYLHAACLIGSKPSFQVVVLGGQDEHKNDIGDCWLLGKDTEQHCTWSKLNLQHDTVAKRCGHSVSTFVMAPNCLWLLIVGGFQSCFTDILPVSSDDDTMIVELEFCNGQWKTNMVFDATQLGGEIYTQRFQERLKKGRIMLQENYFATKSEV